MWRFYKKQLFKFVSFTNTIPISFRIKLLLLSKKTLNINRNSIFQHFTNVKQLAVLARLMGYIQLIGHV